MILTKKKNCDIKFHSLFSALCCVYHTCYKYLISHDGFLLITIEMTLSTWASKSPWDRNSQIKTGLTSDEKNSWWSVMVWSDDFIQQIVCFLSPCQDSGIKKHATCWIRIKYIPSKILRDPIYKLQVCNESLPGFYCGNKIKQEVFHDCGTWNCRGLWEWKRRQEQTGVWGTYHRAVVETKTFHVTGYIS